WLLLGAGGVLAGVSVLFSDGSSGGRLTWIGLAALVVGGGGGGGGAGGVFGALLRRLLGWAADVDRPRGAGARGGRRRGRAGRAAATGALARGARRARVPRRVRV